MFMNELERRAQIEETWARRGVFADAISAERMAEYIARRDLARLGTEGYPEVAAVAQRKAAVAAIRGAVAPLIPVPARQGGDYFGLGRQPATLATLVARLNIAAKDDHVMHAEWRAPVLVRNRS
jgi:hypothetical protein